MDDDELMVRGAKGDEDAFRVLIERWERPVFAFLVRMIGSPEEAQDLGQETFLRMCRCAGRYRPSGHFKSWLFRIAGNLARSRLRRRKILQWVPFQSEFHDRGAPGDTAEESLLRRDRVSAVKTALKKLPARQREAIVLRQYHGWSYQEIACTMKTTLPAVESLLHRAMSALREELIRKKVH